MIDNSLQTVVAELNTYLRTKLSLTADPVTISGLPADEPEDDADGSIIATVISIEEDKLGTQKHSPNAKMVSLNLYVLFSAYFVFEENTDALKYISAVIAFFGSKPEFNAENTPGLDPAIKELAFDIHNLTFSEQSDMWRSLGAKSRPAVLYKVYGASVMAS